MNKKMMMEIDEAFDDWLETLSPKELAEFYELVSQDLDSIEDAKGVQIVEDDEVVAPKEEIVEPKVAVKKTKCRCCGFAKKSYRVLPSGLCKSCDAAFRDESGEVITDGDVITVVGKQGKRGRNNVSIVHPISGRRWLVQRKVRLDS
jgi:predicted Zn-ribbon and HTH transcriptional regulator